MKFSQRHGFAPVPEALAPRAMPDALRNSLWNVLDERIWSRGGFRTRSDRYGTVGAAYPFAKRLFRDFLKQPTDQVQFNAASIMQFLRKFFFAAEWYVVYDFLEATMEYLPDVALEGHLNDVLTRELAAYRVVGGRFTEVTAPQEVEAIRQALVDDRFKAVTVHIASALEKFSNRDAPDFRNAIKEAISAVEAMARIVTGDEKATLGGALKVLEQKHGLHPALKDGYSKIYGWTSDAGGIRHAMTDPAANVTADDAKFFIASCSAFVNYLKSLT